MPRFLVQVSCRCRIIFACRSKVSPDISDITVRRVMTKAFHLRAYGTYEPDYSENKEMQQTEDKFANPFEWFMSLGGKANENTKIISRDKKLKCPADFIVTVNKASIVCFGQSFDIRIAGQGYLRVLYADPKLRIFVRFLSERVRKAVRYPHSLYL